ncbi:outer membrane beta-barrel protein [Aureimonas sp. ME7]|uniref:outer membrane protein n=1 Tax=Aureimonas sp. ME7 TaxID=2744252 RepID=UPI0015F42D9D|nr:outer membrane beta-barrel protein [Aureimonas sp. ME7]
MKRFALLLASTAFVTPALAADVVYEEPAAPVVAIAPAYNWTGFYVGGQAGVAFNNDAGDVRYNPNTGAFATTAFSGGSGDSDDAAFIGGVHVGYDYQINNFLVGVVADINYIDASSNSSFSITSAPGVVDTFGVSSDINFVGTVRAKAGIVADRFAVYATGGLAYADTDTKYFAPGTLTATNGFVPTVNSDSDDVGYAVGAGVDYLVTPNLSLGLEYLYTDLGESDTTVTYTNGTLSQNFTATSNDDLDFHTVWAKASFRFN